MSKQPTFTPPAWLRNSHLQVMGSVFIPRHITLFPSEDRYFDLADGSKLVTECTWQKNRRQATTLLIVHGLNGSTISSYIRGTASKAYEAGFNVVRVNLRNGGNREEMSKTLCHAGQSDDISTVVRELIHLDQLPRIGIIAFSFGANISLKAAAEWGDKAPPQVVGIVGVSPLIDLDATTDALDHKAPAIYRYQLLKGLKSMVRERAKLFPGQYDTSGLASIKHLRAFDDMYAPYNGFKDAADYYAKASCLPHLGKITIPTLLISSEDDAVIPVKSFRQVDNPHIQLLITKHGGHGGFISRESGKDPDRHWAETRAVEFFSVKSPGIAPHTYPQKAPSP
ncbi:MAG TPA: alpha/beta fold hydrolase [Verrucomicrobiae bacterium]|nr:alpha/beta fold hydrolase [Verrucomicrobiae bacterium]